VNNLEAHSSKGGPNALAQKEENCVGHNGLFMKEIVGPGGTASPDAEKRGIEVFEASLKSVRHEDEAPSPVKSQDGTQMSISGLLPKKLGRKDQPCRYTGQTSADDGIVEVVSPPSRDADETRAKSRSNSPPCRRKKKGIAELGDSCPKPRRLVRLSAKHPQGGPLAHFREGSSSIFISDTAIRICNSQLCDPGNVEEPDRLWGVGKQVGLI